MSSKFSAWIQASRLPSQSYIAFPLMTGQVLALSITGAWSWAVFVLVQLFGIFDQLYIVYANDYADRETDLKNQSATPFSGGSRVLVEGKLTPSELARGAWLMVAGALATTLVLAIGWGRWWAVPLGMLGLLLLWAYSFRPFRLSYRGGGEVLQTLGVGGVLPLLAYYSQAGSLQGFPWWLLVPFFALNLSNAITTALPDRRSDRLSKKRTVPVWAGLSAAQWSVMGLHLVGLVVFLVLGSQAVGPFHGGTWAALAVSAIALVALFLLRRRARPGSTAIVGFVAASIVVNLAWMVAVMVTALFPL